MMIVGPQGSDKNSVGGYKQLVHVAVGELNKLKYNPSEINLLISIPHDNTNADVHFTMYESDVLPKIQVGVLNTRKLIIVPNRKDADDFRACGVIPQIEVCPLYCAGRFVAFPPIRPFRFVSVGTEHGIPERKRHQDIIEAFKMAFPTEPDVELWIKRSPACPKLHSFDSRVHVTHDKLDAEAMARFYYTGHVGVLPGGMESWCLPAAELASLGRASLIPLYRGPAEFLDRTCSFPLPYEMRPAPQTFYYGRGSQAYASMTGLIHAMREVYHNPFEVYKRGIAAAQRAAEYSPERFGVRLRDILQNYVRSIRPSVETRSTSNVRYLVGSDGRDRSEA